MGYAYSRVVRFLASAKFFSVIMAIFIVESVWVAISAKFPMAFDEGYHFAVIKIYSSHLGPVFFHQPPGPATYGALPHNTSFLYHYFMSIPYDIVGLWTNSLLAHVIVLRLIDVALFAVSLILIRKVLLKTKASPAIVNVSLLFFILIPVVPLIAGQISYDNGLIPMIALTLFLTVNFSEKLRSKKRIDVAGLIVLYSICLLACMVKFPFLPILTALTIYLIFIFWKFTKDHPGALSKNTRIDWQKISLLNKVALISLLVASTAFWIDIYGVNIIKYHNPVPQCGQVLGAKECASFAPWARNYADAKWNTGVDINPLRFSASWLYGMFDRLFFTINGPGGPSSNDNHLAPVVSITALVLSGVGFLLVVFRYGKSIVKDDWVLGMLLFVSGVYVISLWGRNYHDFLHLGKIVAINGRYLVPIIIPAYLIVARAYQKLLEKHLYIKLILFVVVVLAYLEGGGVIGFIFYSNAQWYWPSDQFANNLNNYAKDLIRPLFIYHKST
jgi:hypothetical protein